MFVIFKLSHSNYNIVLPITPFKHTRKKFFLAQILHTFSKRFLSDFSIFSTVIHSINRLSTIFRLIHSHLEQLRKTGKAPCKTSASPCKAQQKRPARRCPHLQNRSFISIFANYSIFHQKPHNPHVSPSFLGFPHSFFRHYNCRLIRLFTSTTLSSMQLQILSTYFQYIL